MIRINLQNVDLNRYTKGLSTFIIENLQFYIEKMNSSILEYRKIKRRMDIPKIALNFAGLIA
ncbi:MAG TPA: hypothetical protein DCX03_12330 [Bacteroidales bacterium]|nr:hypothetical protein [Bacteroidales bacterium]